ncbi:hypothetical protein L228DRAFT_151109 [Xylona heveae TC161]|uniref:Uncharacterized protein n=1 Tax=Xylona heveae (strain CBS 132557 / TC161) TaxID=1328760 RepID=A0A165GLW5_XYLHT|nr:hypothetical protein L228DRAFT_151109 [Xylona heveae TC161]KZF22353.1 hypothetical protein L228DRAFT_151109 [Xylona heveae TC161]
MFDTSDTFGTLDEDDDCKFATHPLIEAVHAVKSVQSVQHTGPARPVISQSASTTPSHFCLFPVPVPLSVPVIFSLSVPIFFSLSFSVPVPFLFFYSFFRLFSGFSLSVPLSVSVIVPVSLSVPSSRCPISIRRNFTYTKGLSFKAKVQSRKASLFVEAQKKSNQIKYPKGLESRGSSDTI